MDLYPVLKKFDAYPKTSQDFSIKTTGGAAITLISTTLIICLVLSEFRQYLSPVITEELFVDTTRNNKLRINLNITIERIACEYLSLDAMDSSGGQHLRIEHNIFKRRLDLNGEPITQTKPIKEIITSVDSTTSNHTCGSCYGAEANSTHCCNTCDEVMEAYIAKKWAVQFDKITQCDKNIDKSHNKKITDEGCQIVGYLEVNRVSGSFHIAPGASFSISQFHVHDFPLVETNLAHTINHLSFGEKIGDFANVHPLDGTIVTSDDKSKMYNYYIKIVPTMYEMNNTHIINTNQFSVTRHKKVLNQFEKGMPGIFFSYELSPLIVKYSYQNRSFGHFATNCCAIFGGIFTVAGMIANLAHNSYEILRRKGLYGKLN